ncbi:hypothetical protein C1645_824331 [Glomus cerebriforme]|uniref:C2H2-type domain-containing protein n=1 Tax=Glomus cerebriforme TaxID=658196 RepID=A0A397SUA0_9GLOM|nr:hypothetical protein C1645_824331 [Glomus cerebriforme]
MSYKCPICEKTFSQCIAYNQHVQKCIKTAEINDNDAIYSSEMNTESYENIQAELESTWPNNLSTAIKEHHFNAVATSQNLSLEEAEVLKFDQEYFIADIMALKCFYMQNLYCKDMSIKNWNNICNRKFVKNFSSPEAQKHFLRLFCFQRQGYDEKNVMKGLKAKENIQWEITCYKAKENLEKSVVEDLHKSYLAKYWESRVKETPDLHLAIKIINAIASNWCRYDIESDKKRIGPKGQ